MVVGTSVTTTVALHILLTSTLKQAICELVSYTSIGGNLHLPLAADLYLCSMFNALLQETVVQNQHTILSAWQVWEGTTS